MTRFAWKIRKPSWVILECRSLAYNARSSDFALYIERTLQHDLKKISQSKFAAFLWQKEVFVTDKYHTWDIDSVHTKIYLKCMWISDLHFLVH